MTNADVSIRPFTRDEVVLYQRWMGDKAVCGAHVQTEDESLDELLADFDQHQGWQSDTLRRWIVTNSAEEIMGFAHAWQFDKYEPHMEVGRVITPEFRGRGIGKRLLEVVTETLFRECPTDRVQAISACTNRAASRHWEELGWTIEGRLRGFMTLGDEKVDCFLGAILRKDWEALQKKAIESETVC